ncbi:MAG: AMP-binding protein [Gammaproteobacteria bacterium]
MEPLPFIRPYVPAAPVAWRADRPLSARQLLADAAGLARLLPERRCVVNLCEDRYRFTASLGAALLRGQLTLLPASRAPRALAELLRDYPSSYCLVDGAGVLPEGTARLAFPPEGFPAPPDEIPAFPPSQPALVAFTSGSTGAAQPHLKPWGSLVRGAELAARRFGLDKPPLGSIVATVPAQHMYGLETSVLLPLHSGYAGAAGRPFFPEDIRTQLAQVPAPRILVTTPVHLRACVRSGLRWPPLAFILSATAPLPPALAHQAEQTLDAPVLEVFGFTEAGSIASRRTLDGESWQTYDGVSLRHGEQGLVVAGGHLDAPVPVHDLIEVSDGVRFRLQGRATDLIEVAGKRASLGDLNQRLQQLPGVADAVFLMPEPSPTGVTRLMAFVVAPGMSPERVLGMLREALDPAFLPRPLVMVDALPRTAVGKLPREALLALAARLPASGLAAEAWALDAPRRRAGA